MLGEDDDDGVDVGNPVRVHVRVAERGESIGFGFSASADQTRGPANLRPPLVRDRVDGVPLRCDLKRPTHVLSWICSPSNSRIVQWLVFLLPLHHCSAANAAAAKLDLSVRSLKRHPHVSS